MAEYERGLFDDLTKAEQKAAGLAQDVIKAAEQGAMHQSAETLGAGRRRGATACDPRIGGVVTTGAGAHATSFRLS